jgi:hypothetical protein
MSGLEPCESKTVGGRAVRPGRDQSLIKATTPCGCWQTVELTIAGYDLLRGEPVLSDPPQAAIDVAPRPG